MISRLVKLNDFVLEGVSSSPGIHHWHVASESSAPSATTSSKESAFNRFNWREMRRLSSANDMI